MQAITAFVRLSRLNFLLGGLAGFALGAAVAAFAGAHLTFAGYAAGQAMVTAFHLMTHYANDYFDRHTDVRAQFTEFSGGSGVLVDGALVPGVALAAALFCAGTGALIALGFAVTSGPAVALIGVTIGCLAWSYSAPPFRLAARGWGELDAVLVVGILVPLCGYAVFTGSLGSLAVTATVAPACAMFALMIAVEWPDRAADAAGGKRNLVVRFGSRTGARLGAIGAAAVVPALLLSLAFGAPVSLAPMSVLLVGPVWNFARALRFEHTPAAEIAARGVALFLLTVMFALFAYLAVLR